MGMATCSQTIRNIIYCSLHVQHVQQEGAVPHQGSRALTPRTLPTYIMYFNKDEVIASDGGLSDCL